MTYNVEEEYIKCIQEIAGRIISSENPSQDIRRTRASLGVTQDELGKLVKVRRETISRIENGSIKPTFEFIRKFSKTMAAAKIIRDLSALEEVSMLDGKNISPLSPALLRLYFNIPAQELELISDVGIKGYQKSRAKIIKKIKEA